MWAGPYCETVNSISLQCSCGNFQSAQQEYYNALPPAGLRTPAEFMLWAVSVTQAYTAAKSNYHIQLAQANLDRTIAVNGAWNGFVATEQTALAAYWTSLITANTGHENAKATASTELQIAKGNAAGDLNSALAGAESAYDITMNGLDSALTRRSTAGELQWSNAMLAAATSFLSGATGAQTAVQTAAASGWSSFVGDISGTWQQFMGDIAGGDPQITQDAANEAGWTTSVTTAMSATAQLGGAVGSWMSSVLGLSAAQTTAHNSAAVGWFGAAYGAWDTFYATSMGAIAGWGASDNNIARTFNNTVARLTTAYNNAIRSAEASYRIASINKATQATIEAEAAKGVQSENILRTQLANMNAYPEQYSSEPTHPGPMLLMFELYPGDPGAAARAFSELETITAWKATTEAWHADLTALPTTAAPPPTGGWQQQIDDLMALVPTEDPESPDPDAPEGDWTPPPRNTPEGGTGGPGGEGNGGEGSPGETPPGDDSNGGTMSGLSNDAHTNSSSEDGPTDWNGAISWWGGYNPINWIPMIVVGGGQSATEPVFHWYYGNYSKNLEIRGAQAELDAKLQLNNDAALDDFRSSVRQQNQKPLPAEYNQLIQNLETSVAGSYGNYPGQLRTVTPTQIPKPPVATKVVAEGAEELHRFRFLFGHNEYIIADTAKFTAKKSELMEYYRKHCEKAEIVEMANLGGAQIDTVNGRIAIAKDLDKYPLLKDGYLMEELFHFQQLHQRGWFGRPLTAAENKAMEDEVVQLLLGAGFRIFDPARGH